MSTEIVELKEFPGYGVDREGNVYSLEREIRHSFRSQKMRKLPFRKLRPGKGSHGYWTVNIFAGKKPGNYCVHRLMAMAFLGIKQGQVVDHINRVKTDNRLENLRIVTDSQNAHNRRNAVKGLRGAYFQQGYWFSQIQLNKKQHYLGSFDTEEEAHAAYCAAAKAHYGEFCCDELQK